MASPGDAPADGPPAARRGTRDRGSWLSTWAGDDTRPADEQTVLKSTACGAILTVGCVRHPIPSDFSPHQLDARPIHPVGHEVRNEGPLWRTGTRSVPDL